MSHKALSKPIVADYTGDLYNKDAIIQFLLPDDVSTLDKAEAESFIQGRIKALKDVVEVQFEVEHDERMNTDKWVCPVTRKELGPNVKAVFIVPCGHAFSSEAIKEMKSNECVQCGQSYESPRDVVPILPTTETEKQFVIDRIETLRTLGLTHSLKKAAGSKKRKAKEAAAERENGAVDGKEGAIRDFKASTKSDLERTTSSKLSSNGGSAGIKNAATASLNARVLEELETKKKRRLLNENDNIQSLFSQSNSADKKHKDGDFMRRGFQIPANAKHG